MRYLNVPHLDKKEGAGDGSRGSNEPTFQPIHPHYTISIEPKSPHRYWGTPSSPAQVVSEEAYCTVRTLITCGNRPPTQWRQWGPCGEPEFPPPSRSSDEPPPQVSMKLPGKPGRNEALHHLLLKPKLCRRKPGETASLSEIQPHSIIQKRSGFHGKPLIYATPKIWNWMEKKINNCPHQHGTDVG